MTDDILIQHHFLFQKGFFERHPSLFDIYFRNTPRKLYDKLEKTKAALTAYEGTIQWPAIRGPGFCGATHPGAGKSFNGYMTGCSPSFYNSDCLYVHPGLNIFAVSDPPGITTISRKLFEKLDDRLRKTTTDRLDTVINDLAAGIQENGPTLALIQFQQYGISRTPNRAFVYIAGDTEVYRGNFKGEKIKRINGSPHFWGTACHDLKPRVFELNSNDFFLIVSDGISSLRQTVPEHGIEKILWEHIIRDPEKFAENVTMTCNRVFTQNNNGRSRTLLGGTDDITALLVVPSALAQIPVDKGYILGGHIG